MAIEDDYSYPYLLGHAVRSVPSVLQDAWGGVMGARQAVIDADRAIRRGISGEPDIRTPPGKPPVAAPKPPRAVVEKPADEPDDFDSRAGGPFRGPAQIVGDDGRVERGAPHLRYQLGGGDWHELGDKVDDAEKAPYRSDRQVFGEVVPRTVPTKGGGVSFTGGTPGSSEDAEAYRRYRHNLYGDEAENEREAKEALAKILIRDPFARERLQAGLEVQKAGDIERARLDAQLEAQQEKMSMIETFLRQNQKDLDDALTARRKQPDYAGASPAKRKQIEEDTAAPYKAKEQRYQQDLALTGQRAAPNALYQGGLQSGLVYQGVPIT